MALAGLDLVRQKHDWLSIYRKFVNSALMCQERYKDAADHEAPFECSIVVTDK